MTALFLVAGLHANDLRAPYGVAEIMAHVEARLSITEGGRLIYTEEDFPVAELARELRAWSATAHRADYQFGDHGFPEPGAVRICRTAEGWRVGSVFAPDSWSAPRTKAQIDREIAEFTTEVVDTCRDRLGIDLTSVIRTQNR